ncbi:MAG TPA: phosphatidate cytidylyltransferase [Sphingobium sp.]|nr:phosphatidate cytidylyltransferase [Sphingobium sp.]
MAGGARRSDLGVRTLSAIVMLAVAGTALWLGGAAFTALIALVALGVLWEFWGMIRAFAASWPARLAWLMFALVYVGLAVAALWDVRSHGQAPLFWTLLLLLIVWATDIGAYFAGRLIGGPKIAPRISPSKTWSGLGGGMLAATLVVALMVSWYFNGVSAISEKWSSILLLGIPLPVIAQAGDFFESALKRAAGVKDSGRLIPGHGGLFDRVDGLLPVAILYPCWIGALAW